MHALIQHAYVFGQQPTSSTREIPLFNGTEYSCYANRHSASQGRSNHHQNSLHYDPLSKAQQLSISKSNAFYHYEILPSGDMLMKAERPRAAKGFITALD